MNVDYNVVNMAKANEIRNRFIISLFNEGKNSVEIREELEKQGYAQISRYRIWLIYKSSSDYVPRKRIIMFCNFCLENKVTRAMFQIKEFASPKVKARICTDCYNKFLPPQPIKQ